MTAARVCAAPAPPRVPAALGGTALGVLVAGAATAAALALAARALGPEGFGALATFWSLAYAVTAALLAPLEQETGRRVAEGEAPRAAAARAVPVAAAVVAGTVLTAVVAWPAGLGRVLGGDWWMAVALVGLVASNAAALTVRGALGASGQVAPYAAVVGGEGLARLGGCVLLAAAGTTDAGAYAAVVTVASLAWVPTLPRLAGGGGQRASLPAIRAPLARLAVASAGAAVFAQGLPAVAGWLAGRDEAADVGRFQAALTLATAPAFLLAAVPPVLLPAVSRAARDHGRPAVARAAAVAATATLAAGVGALVGLALVGDALVRAVYGPAYAVGPGTLVALGLVAVPLLLAGVLVPVLVALRAHGRVALGWAAGAATFAAALAVPGAAVARVTLAAGLGGLVVAAVLSTAAVRAVARLPLRPEVVP